MPSALFSRRGWCLSAFLLKCRARIVAERTSMIANAVFVATLIFLALGFWSMHELHFLVPWRSLILHTYLKSITLYAALLFANILGLTVWIERKFFLRDTGRKLRHLDQEIHTGQSELSDEILAQFGDEEER
jgi:ABC-type enterochelin transport system permease subunit